MQIAIIGTGNVGLALAGSFIKAGHGVTLAARDADKTRQIASRVGASAAATAKEAAAAADVVVIAIPYGEVESVAKSIASVTAGKVVIDATNPLKADFSGLATEGGPSGAERLAKLLPDAAVAKAFNTVLASLQANPNMYGTTLDALFATDDDHARKVMRDLIASMGFRAVDAGPLAGARELEALAWLNIKLNASFNGSWTSSAVFLGLPAAATTELVRTTN
jgi:8-hydroxy-5-deazaflavin:NADPH oxidoreductase